MQRELWNDSWRIGPDKGLLDALFAGAKKPCPVAIPHDAMIHETRDKAVLSGAQSGFYPGGAYQYEKYFFVPEDWKNQTITFEFEGAYRNARVYMNGDYAGGHPNGYTNFYVNADQFLCYGRENKITVIVNNAGEPGSRWYTGSGLYRNVNLLRGRRLHIAVDGLRLTTPEIDPQVATVVADIHIQNQEHCGRRIHISTEIRDAKGALCGENLSRATVFGGSEIHLRQRIVVENPTLWDCDHPNLYTCTVRLLEGDTEHDRCCEILGIRSLQLDAVRGLRMNGVTVNLRGTCIHHDNGILGAATLEYAESRRCAQLKAAGFNCIRSAHHPMSRAMLTACDRLGMLVIDELSDIWTLQKNRHDYSSQFPDYWEKDVALLVAKDFNHPSVIFYCMGNELPETASAKGAELNRLISNKFKSLDDTRYTTNAINGLLTASRRMDEVLGSLFGTPTTLQDVMQMAASTPSAATEAEQRDEGGAGVLNGMMSFTAGPMADRLVLDPLMNEMIEEFSDGMDIAGYNYMTGRHEKEPTFNKNRVVLGTETYPADIVRLWDIVERCPHVIGDMTWTGYDYLGEAGCGIFYYDGTQNFSSHWPDRLAYIGDIDLTGYRRPLSYLREIVFGLRKEPYVAVRRMNRSGQTTTKTPWMWKDNVESWTWPGYEGKNAFVDVYCDAPEVELFLNETSLGRKPAGKEAEFMACYTLPYTPGRLRAVAYRQGNPCESFVLSTAKEVQLWAQLDRPEIGCNDLAFVTISLCDATGVLQLNQTRDITVTVEGAGYLGGLGSGNPQSETPYDAHTCPTYDGRLLAAIRSGNDPGEIRITLAAPGFAPVVKKVIVHKRLVSSRMLLGDYEK